MKSLIYTLFFVYTLLFLISCGDSNAPTSTGPSGESVKLDTLDSPERVWIDTAAIYLDTQNYSFFDTIIYEVHKLDSSTGLPIATEDSAEIIISDSIKMDNEPSGMIRVNWSSVEDADFYYVLVTDTGDAGFSYYWKVSVDSATKDAEGNMSFLVRGLKPEYSYEASVFGYNSVKQERGSSTTSDRSVDLKGSPAPQNISVDVFGNTAIVKWSEVEDSRKYNIIYTNILTDSYDTAITFGSETSIQIDVAENTVYKVRIVPEGFVVVDSNVLIDLGPSFTKIDTIYPYDPTLPVDSITLLFPYVLFSTFVETPANDDLETISGGYFFKGDIWSLEGQDSLEEVVLNSFNIGKNEITNKEYIEYLNDLLNSNIILKDSSSKDTTLSKVLTSEVTLWDTTISKALLYNSTIHKAGDTVSDTIIINFSTAFDSIVYDTITSIDTLTFPKDSGKIIFQVIEGGDVHYDTTSATATFFLQAIAGDTLKVNDTIITKTIVPDIVTSDTLALFDTTFSKIVTMSDTITKTMYLYSKIGIEGKKYFLLSDNSRIKLEKKSLDTTVTINNEAYLQDPVKGISWEGAAAYCNWLSKSKNYSLAYIENDSSFTLDTTSDGYRLPTEAEFEYVQSASFLSTKQKYSWGSDPLKITTEYDSLQNFSNLSKYFNITGLTGNLIEWCSDSWNYNALITTKSGIIYNPINFEGNDHVLKGGSFIDTDKALTHAASYKLSLKPASLSVVGFRVARWPQ